MTVEHPETECNCVDVPHHWQDIECERARDESE